MQGVILAAGRGTRLKPISLTRSKAMVPIVGKPIVERVMDDLVANGVEDLILVISPDDEEIVAHFAGRSEIGASVRFVHQAERLGMAHALQYAAPLIDDDFLLSACDNLISPAHVGRMVSRWKADPQTSALLTLMPVEPERLGSVGIVEITGNWVTRIVEKPTPDEAPSNISSLPLYLFSRRLLDYLPQVPLSSRGEYELQDAIQLLIEGEGRVGGVTTAERLTLTSPADLLALSRHYLALGAYPESTDWVSGPGSQTLSPVYVETGASIGRDCAIGPDVYVEHDARVGRGAVLRNSVVLRGSSIPDGAVVENQVVARGL
jgi:bifunctional UDP-N-acetylglucosamine pyrophosphorylase/glucosamine-1-phosphate N-acetyltransferase